MTEMENKIRVFVKELRNGLTSSTSKSDIIKWLSVCKAIFSKELAEHEINNLTSSFGWEQQEISALRTLVRQSHGQRIFECIISLFTLEWVTELSQQKFQTLVKPIFVESDSFDAFTCLFEIICSSQKKDFAFHKCVSLLEESVTRQHLFCLLEQHLQCTEDSTSKTVLSVDAQNIIATLASLPEKLANRLGHENSDAFLPQNYVPTLALALYDCLHSSFNLLSKSQDISLLMISALVGKICLVGYSDLLMDTLLPYLCIKVRSDYLWCRICERIFSCMPARNLEFVVTAVLKKVPWYGLVEKFLGDCVVHNSSVKNLICVKLLLHKYYAKPKLFLHNIVGYLSSYQTRRPLFLKVFVDLLRVWGDKSSMKHISSGQHLYISKALMLSMSLLNKEEKTAYKNEFLRVLMPGVQAHLESNNNDIRMVGMAVAKSLIQVVDPDGPQLEYEVDGENPTIKDLLSYQGLPDDPGMSEAENVAQTKLSQENEKQDDVLESKIQSMKVSDSAENEDDEELDSDDDLVPYDMSNDKKVAEVKAPRYIRDCMEGLICSNENPSRTEVCLEHAESLIRKNTDGLEEISAEFAKILLHLNDTNSFDNFLMQRFSAMVALAVMCPSPVADYLTSQFYERNYNTRQRLDILEVLANAAQELSQPEKVKDTTGPPVAVISEISPSSQPSLWRQVVQKRIESNTRRFGKGRSRPLPKPTENRFAKVAGQFFYLLMTKVDHNDPCMDLLGKDTLLLYRLLYTLAIVLHAATNLPNATQMGKALLEFTWPLRSHPDPCVRQAVLICTSTFFLVVPTFQLMSELQSEVTEVKYWLEDVIEKDADSECQKMAAQALLLLDEQIKKEMAKEKER